MLESGINWQIDQVAGQLRGQQTGFLTVNVAAQVCTLHLEVFLSANNEICGNSPFLLPELDLELLPLAAHCE
jgi:hypothetical protein